MDKCSKGPSGSSPVPVKLPPPPLRGIGLA